MPVSSTSSNQDSSAASFFGPNGANTPAAGSNSSAGAQGTAPAASFSAALAQAGGVATTGPVMTPAAVTSAAQEAIALLSPGLLNSTQPVTTTPLLPVAPVAGAAGELAAVQAVEVIPTIGNVAATTGTKKGDPTEAKKGGDVEASTPATDEPPTAEQLAYAQAMAMQSLLPLPPAVSPNSGSADGKPDAITFGQGGTQWAQLLSSGAAVVTVRAQGPGLPDGTAQLAQLPGSITSAKVADENGSPALSSANASVANAANSTAGAPNQVLVTPLPSLQPAKTPPVAAPLQSGTAAQPTLPATAAAPSANANDATSAAASVAAATATATATDLTGAPAAAQATIGDVKPVDTNTKSSAVKIAARSRAQPSSGDKTLVPLQKKVTLSAASEPLTEDSQTVGTSAANRENTMPLESRTRSKSLSLDESAFVTGVSASSVDAASVSGRAPVDTAKDVATSHAAQLVKEIHDLADGLSLVGRNSVEVKFQFGSSEKLSVRVELRDGTVQATFRTDSPELRAALSNEWRAQSATSENRTYRFADPVFSSDASTGFSQGGDSSRQQHASEEASGAPVFSFNPRSAASTTSSQAVTSTPRESRPDTALHLHAFA